MCITEYNEEEVMDNRFEEGVEVGEEKGFLKALGGLVKKGVLTLAQAAEEANMTVTEFETKAGLKV